MTAPDRPGTPDGRTCTPETAGQAGLKLAFENWFGGEGYDDQGRFDMDEMEFAFEAGAEAQRDLAAAAPAPDAPTCPVCRDTGLVDVDGCNCGSPADSSVNYAHERLCGAEPCQCGAWDKLQPQEPQPQAAAQAIADAVADATHAFAKDEILANAGPEWDRPLVPEQNAIEYVRHLEAEVARLREQPAAAAPGQHQDGEAGALSALTADLAERRITVRAGSGWETRTAMHPNTLAAQLLAVIEPHLPQAAPGLGTAWRLLNETRDKLGELADEMVRRATAADMRGHADSAQALNEYAGRIRMLLPAVTGQPGAEGQ